MNPTIERHLLTMRQCACMFPRDCPMCSALMRAVVVCAETDYADAVVRAKGRGRGVAGACSGCGCTDETPCKRDGAECCWLDDTETLCSACAPDEEE